MSSDCHCCSPFENVFMNTFFIFSMFMPHFSSIFLYRFASTKNKSEKECHVLFPFFPHIDIDGVLIC